MKHNILSIGFVLAILAVIVVSQSLFIVDERQQAIVLQLGNPVGDTREPGLHLKIPVIQEVRYFDARVLSVDPPPDQVVIASSTIENNEENEPKVEQPTDETLEKAPAPTSKAFQNISGEPIIVDSFARYKIVDALQFMKTLQTEGQARSRLTTILNSETRSVLGKTSLKQLLSDERARVMENIRRRVNRSIQAGKLGIELVDVRIVRADLTKELRASTVNRMKSELKERATKTRAEGDELAKEIRATAEKERTVILANAERDSQILRGEGDNEAYQIYSKAFNKDKEFYGFIRSMEAYKKTLADSDTRLILSPDSEFFKYFERGGR